MKSNLRVLAAALVAAALAAPAIAPADAQTGHPAKGTWLGFWGPNDDVQRRLILVLDWENRALSGVLNPGPDAIPITSAEIDYDTWTMVVEADVSIDGGEARPWVATGKLENLGSWTNRRYSGSYTYGDESGAFTATLN